MMNWFVNLPVRFKIMVPNLFFASLFVIYYFLWSAKGTTSTTTTTTDGTAPYTSMIFVIGTAIVMCWWNYYVSQYFNGKITYVNKFLRMLFDGDFGQWLDDSTKTLKRIEIKKDSTDEFGESLEHIDHIMTALQNFSQDLHKLTVSIVNGDLKSRMDDHAYKGDFKKIMFGVNRIIGETLRPIHEAIPVLQEMSKGNLGTRMKSEYKGDHDVIKNAVNTTIDSLNTIISEIKGVVTNVDSSSQKVAETGQGLNAGAAQQAAALEEISASITEIGSQINQNADHAGEAKSLSDRVKDDALNGNNQMSNMVSAMADIDESSKNIAKIIKVIDEIAFQTNLLALNAAVEAARAGKHGKGFAVVAEEVRNLAARSAEAAKETTNLISDSNERVRNGLKMATDTAEGLKRIVNGINEVANFMQQISSASQEQSHGVSQIGVGMKRIESVTQRNTRSAEETAQAADYLSNQSVQLINFINKFKLDSSYVANNNSKLAVASNNVSSQTNKGVIALKMKNNNRYDNNSDLVLDSKKTSAPVSPSSLNINTNTGGPTSIKLQKVE
ncbi:MAG: methyl-accepting chemotaxis protein [Oligoflexia bacterium]|nr:methyl-accepting chemotaxis protein [Oligoflexia bacterium]